MEIKGFYVTATICINYDNLLTLEDDTQGNESSSLCDMMTQLATVVVYVYFRAVCTFTV